MILNIIDNRDHHYKWKSVDAIIEPTWHDNSVKGADRAPKGPAEGIGYEEMPKAHLADIIKWANRKPFGVTVYLYPPGTLGGTYRVRRPRPSPNRKSREMETA